MVIFHSEKPGSRRPWQRVLIALWFLVLLTTVAKAQTRAPVLLTHASSTRAIAFESPTYSIEPFLPTSSVRWSTDNRTRVVLYALNLTLQPGENFSAVTVEAEDGTQRRYNFEVEYVGLVPEQPLISAIIIRLSNDLTAVGDLLVQVKYQGRNSNRARMAMGHVGGGLPDDAGAGPATVPPYQVSGRVTENGAGLGGVLVSLNGSQVQTMTTDSTGKYSFTVMTAGENYQLTVSNALFDFTPPNETLSLLSNSLGRNFAATRRGLTISGQAMYGTVGVGGVTMIVSGSHTASTTTDSNGHYSIPGLPPNGNYIVSALPTDLYNFNTQTVASLASNQSLNLTGTLREYVISGQVLTGTLGLDGVTVSLTGAQTRQVTTDQTGAYAFTVLAGSDYTVTAHKALFTFAPPSRTFQNLRSNQSFAHLLASRDLFSINGHVRDDAGQIMSGVTIALMNEVGGTFRTTDTGVDGSFSFPDVISSYGYTVAPAGSNFLTFPPQTISQLTSNLVLSFTATRRTYEIRGRLFNASNHPLDGITVHLTGPQAAATVTDINGNYSFTNLPAGGNYTVAPVSGPIYDFTTDTVTNIQADHASVFTGNLRRYIVSGHVSNGAQPFAGVQVELSGYQSQTTTTDNNGNYSFPDLAAGENYVVTPSRNNYTLAPLLINIETLTQNVTTNFDASLNQYRLSGKITDGPDQGLSGVELTLSGSVAGSTQTDAGGNYSFTVPAEGDYTITPAKPYYLFSPEIHTFNDLGGNALPDFDAVLRTYAISGQVTNTSGDPLVGIEMSLVGTQTTSVRTGLDGRFSFAASATLDYTLVPSIEQASYIFSPLNESFPCLTADHDTNFAATLAPVPDPSYVLEYDGLPRTVDYGEFWEAYVDLGHFFWEFWAMPGDNAGATYLLSDGYGGNHALLFGFTMHLSDLSHYVLFGNTWDGYVAGQHRVFFESDDGPAPGEWGHFAVGWDGQNIITYFNGVPVGKKEFTGPRATPGYGAGGGRLLIGGSDHNNLVGRIAQVRGFEGTNPLSSGPVSKVESTFAPETVFSPGANLVSNFFTPAPVVADLSMGFDGIAQAGKTHPGKLRGTIFGILNDCGDCPPPTFVIDPTAPNFAQATAPAPVGIPSPAPVPVGAKVFDSFSRPHSTYLFGSKGGLGSTEGGTAGAQAWQSGLDSSQQQLFGILNGRAVPLANSPAVTWVNTGSVSGNLDVRVNRRAGTWGSGLDTGLSFRVVDAGNFFFAYTTGAGTGSSARALTVGYFVGGVRTELVTGIQIPAYTSLRVVTGSDGEIRVYADSTLLYSTSSDLMANAPGAGLFSDSAASGLLKRWDNFTVFDVPPAP